MLARPKKLLQAVGCLFVPLAFFALAFYPMFADTQENARTIACQNNLKSLGAALALYAQDNDNAMPNVSDRSGSHTWREAIFPYVKTKGNDIFGSPKLILSERLVASVGN